MSTSTEQPVFDCPHCGGEIQYDGQSVTQRCTYCGAAVPVPEEFRLAITPAIQVVTPIE
jgi:tRNA(Ile2) C34 agmatinyltransferase TiaS